MIYITFRTDTLLMFKWVHTIKINTIIIILRDIAQPLNSFFPQWFFYSLPDGLLIYSVVFFITIIWKNEDKRFFSFWLSIGLIISVGSEIGQFFNIVPGTFCWVDLIFYFLGTFTALIVTQTKRIRNENKKIFIT